MKCPQDKAAGYTAVSIIVAFVLNLVIGALIAGVSGVSPWSGGSVFSSADDDVQFDKDSPLGKLEEWSKNVEEASEKLEEAGKSGDQDAQAEAFTADDGRRAGRRPGGIVAHGTSEAVRT